MLSGEVEFLDISQLVREVLLFYYSPISLIKISFISQCFAIFLAMSEATSCQIFK